MQLKLRWRNPNTLNVSVEIYRNDTPVAPGDLGVPLVKLNGSITEWVDTTVVNGSSYYYTWKSISGDKVVFTKPVLAKAEYSLGAGPTDLVYGDMSMGFFGTLTYKDLFTSQELMTLVNLNPAYIVGTGLLTWYKFARNGKILYAPSTPLSTAYAFNGIYGAGLVFGTNDNGVWSPTSITPTNQRTIVSKDGNDFIVRLPTGVDDRNNPDRVSTAGGSRRYSEVADLFYSLLNIQPPLSPRLPKFALLGTGGLFNNSNAFCQEFGASGKGYCLVGSGGTEAGTLEVYKELATTLAGAFVPILELVPNKIKEVVL